MHSNSFHFKSYSLPTPCSTMAMRQWGNATVDQVQAKVSSKETSCPPLHLPSHTLLAIWQSLHSTDYTRTQLVLLIPDMLMWLIFQSTYCIQQNYWRLYNEHHLFVYLATKSCTRKYQIKLEGLHLDLNIMFNFIWN